jgi:hypothetical protein
VKDGDRLLTVSLSSPEATPEVVKATSPSVPPVHNIAPIGVLNASAWQVAHGAPVQGLPQADSGLGTGILFTVGGPHATSATLANVTYDGAWSALMTRIKVSSIESLSHLAIELSNDHWRSEVSYDLRRSYPATSDGEWLGLSFAEGNGQPGGPGPHWVQRGPGVFDWSKVDGIRFVAQENAGVVPPVTVEVNQLQSVPLESTGKVVLVFDDAYQSDLSAAAYLHKLDLPANVAVIAQYMETPSSDRMNVAQLRRLQDGWGWDMVNQGVKDVNGIETYVETGDLEDYLADVAAGAQYLEHAGLNSAPNWYVYPHGGTDDKLKLMVMGLYKFALTNNSAADTYPFGDRLAVNAIQLKGAGPTGGEPTPSPAQVAVAIANAKYFHNTLVLTFHRIHASPTDPPGYPLGAFETIANEVKASGLPVLTLSGLDRSNGIPENNRIVVQPGRSSQTVVSLKDRPITGPSSSLWSELTGWL